MYTALWALLLLFDIFFFDSSKCELVEHFPAMINTLGLSRGLYTVVDPFSCGHLSCCQYFVIRGEFTVTLMKFELQDSPWVSWKCGHIVIFL